MTETSIPYHPSSSTKYEIEETRTIVRRHVVYARTSEDAIAYAQNPSSSMTDPESIRVEFRVIPIFDGEADAQGTDGSTTTYASLRNSKEASPRV